MPRKRTTPLHRESLDPGHCSPALRARILGGARLFRRLPVPAMDAVNARFRESHYPAGAVIYREGDAATRLFFVAHGKVKLLQHSRSGDEVVLDILPQGALFGGLAPLGRQSHPESAVAQTECCVLAVTAEAFDRLLQEHPALTRAVLTSVARDLDDARQAIRQLSTAPVEARIAAALLKLAERLGEPDDGGVLIQAPLPQQDLAAMVGSTTETVSRTVAALKRAGHIDAGRQWVRLRDRDALARLAATEAGE